MENLSRTFMKPLTCIFVAALLVAGCATKVPISYIEPSKSRKNITKVAILSFEKDGDVSLRDKVESALSAHTLKKESYFTVVERLGVEKILNQDLGSKWSAAQISGEKLSQKIQADGVVLGSISGFSSNDQRFTEKRCKCDDQGKNCYDYEVSCIRRNYALDAQLRLIEVSSGS